ncbi:DMT family transporter [archaeon]|jgi:drug/metabolite transporter (DMT)-like permease|nr:DMT family transporter [archaeon]
MYLPIFGSFALAVGTILERVVLKHKKMNIKVYHVTSFAALTLLLIPLIFFFWRSTPKALELKNILIFGLIIILSICANMFTFFSMKWEKISNLEPAKITEPLFVILLALIFSFIFGQGLYERNLNILVPALIAGLALIFSHVEKHHLTFNKYFIAAIIGSLFFAAELVLSRLILDFYSPIAFYFVRCTGILILSIIIFRPKFRKHLNGRNSWLILATAAIWIIYRVIIYFGYTSIGIIPTTLIIMLGPIFIYLLSWIFLKDKPTWKNIIASIVILACVIYASFI